jgi:LmbE family N-acetylglucosaminyl deacetylase
MYHSYFPSFLKEPYLLSIVSIIICSAGIILALIYWNKKSLFIKILSVMALPVGIFVITISSFSFFKDNKKFEYEKFKNAQDYNVPLFDKSIKNKTALFIFPHADDEIACAGTIVGLKECGWTINLLTLTQGPINERLIKLNEWKNAANVLHIDNYEILDLPNNSWDNVIADKIEFWYDHQDSIENIVYHAIQKYKPDMVFSFDTVFGAYGHPEHRIAALAVFHVFQNHKTDSSFQPERILQFTLPEKLAQLIFETELYYYNSFRKTLNYSGITTLPAPTIAFDVSNSWTTKRKAALAYVSQYGALKLFLPLEIDTTIHFNTFDREYYFEIKR